MGQNLSGHHHTELSKLKANSQWIFTRIQQGTRWGSSTHGSVVRFGGSSASPGAWGVRLPLSASEAAMKSGRGSTLAEESCVQLVKSGHRLNRKDRRMETKRLDDHRFLFKVDLNDRIPWAMNRFAKALVSVPF